MFNFTLLTPCYTLRDMESTKRSQGIQARAIDTRGKITEAARMLFKEKGYQNTTTRQISERAGVSIGSFYVYFGDKKEIFQDLIEDYYREIQSIGIERLLKEAQNPFNRSHALRAIILNVQNFSDSMGEFYESLNQVSHADSEIQDSIVQFEKRIITQISTTISSFESIHKSADSLSQAYLLYSFIDMNTYRFRRPLPGLEIDHIIEEMTIWLERLLFE